MNTIEQQVWEYLDGTCSVEEKASIEALIATDPEYKKIFLELSDLKRSLSELDLQEPSMRFTTNVMDQLDGDVIPGSLKSLIDKRIIYGISIFFVLVILSCLIIGISGTNWTSSFSGTLNFDLKALNFSKYLNRSGMTAFLFLDIIVLLYFTDAFLRQKLHSKQE